MFERHERQVLQAIVGLQIIEKTTKPRSAPLRIGPGSDVFGDSLKRWSSELEPRIDTVKSGGELKIKSSIVFRLHVLPVRLLAHFDVRHRVTALLDVAHLCGRVFRRAVE